MTIRSDEMVMMTVIILIVIDETSETNNMKSSSANPISTIKSEGEKLLR